MQLFCGELGQDCRGTIFYNTNKRVKYNAWSWGKTAILFSNFALFEPWFFGANVLWGGMSVLCHFGVFVSFYVCVMSVLSVLVSLLICVPFFHHFLLLLLFNFVVKSNVLFLYFRDVFL